MKGDMDFARDAQDSQGAIVGQFLDSKDYATKTRIYNVLAQSVFEMVGFDMLSDPEKAKILETAYKRNPSTPITSGDYVFAFSFFYKINAISEAGKSRGEAKEVAGGIAQRA